MPEALPRWERFMSDARACAEAHNPLEVRGTLTPNRPLADLTWLRVGGPADWLFQPADLADLHMA